MTLITARGLWHQCPEGCRQSLKPRVDTQSIEVLDSVGQCLESLESSWKVPESDDISVCVNLKFAESVAERYLR